MNPEKEKITLGAANTEGDIEKEISLSLPIDDEKVKKPLDLRTEMFVLDLLKTALARQYALSNTERYGIFSDVFEGCVEANEA